MKMTSAYANKLIRKLMGERDYWRAIESARHTYIYTQGGEAIIPEYDFLEVHQTIADIDDKVIRIKHALNVSNSTNTVEVEGRKYTIDMLLVKMTQLTNRKAVLGAMRKLTPKERVKVESPSYRSMKQGYTPDIHSINFDMEVVKAEYEKIESLMSNLQLALDKYNQTVEFDVDI